MYEIVDVTENSAKANWMQPYLARCGSRPPGFGRA